MPVNNIISGQHQLHFIGVGVVVEDKIKNDDEIKVVIPTTMSSIDGVVSELDRRRVSARSPDAMNNIKGKDHYKKVTIKAWWHKEDSGNRNNAPDVRKHESVMIYRYADTDQYFWIDKGREPKYRGLEHAVFTWGNEKSRIKEYDLESSYHMTVSTDEKRIQLYTAKNDGEHTDYDIKLDTKEGYLRIKDGKGNWIKLDSRADSLYGNINKDVELTIGRNTLINIGGNTTINTDGNTTVYTKGNTEVKTDGDTKISSGKNITIDAGESIALKAGSGISVTSSDGTDIKSSELNHNGTNVGDTHKHDKVASGIATTGEPI